MAPGTPLRVSMFGEIRLRDTEGFRCGLSRQFSHFQEINESSVLPSEVSEVISATDLENTIEEDFEETNNVCSFDRILCFT